VKEIVEKMTVNPVFLAMQKICSTKRETDCREKPKPTAKLMKKWSKITISRYHKSWLFFGTKKRKLFKNNTRQNEIKSLFLASKKS
jgi:hypothetical protein